MAFETTGPRQATGMSSFGSMRLVDITLMPLCVWPGRMPSASAVSGFVMPKVFGMDGPVTSASRMPTFFPRFCISLASRLVTSDLPTPPLPDTTPITCLTLVRLLGARVGGAVAASGLAAAAALVRAFFCHDSFFLGFQRPRAAGAPLVSPG